MGDLNNENFIWDLHIHTCKCPKGSSDFSKFKTVDEYLDEIVGIFSKHSDLKMVSFTDHNLISKEVYKGFISRDTGITVIPGIEVDLYVNVQGSKTADYKHIIFYFDNCSFDYETHCDLINNFISDNKNEGGELELGQFIGFLLTKIKIKFLISPHAFKQRQRGLEYDWNDERITKEMIKMYTDQFFCFWESSGESEIANCKKMLEEFNSDNKISIIAFSDSNNSEKLKQYLDNPPQYFYALPSFEGLRMVGSEPRRIVFKKERMNESLKGKYIGFIANKDNEPICLSPKLNVIIGGRGSGKSILLESIYVSSEKGDLSDKKRQDFIDAQGFEIKTLANQKLPTSFNFSFLEQNYIYKLFSDSSDITKKDCFKRYFDKLEDFDESQIKNDYIGMISNCCADTPSSDLSNIVNISGEIVKTIDVGTKINFVKKKETSSIGYIDYEGFKAATLMPRIVPTVLKDNSDYLKLRDAFYNDIIEIIHRNNELIARGNIDYVLYKSYNNLILGKNEKKKTKEASLNRIKTKIQDYKTQFIRRAMAVRRIVELQTKIKVEEPHSVKVNGIDGNIFIISKELIIQNPLEYLHNVMVGNLDSRKLEAFGIDDKKKIENLQQMLKLFIERPSDVLMESKEISDVLDELESLEQWSVKQESRIYFQKSGCNACDLSVQSPGTRANLLMEFIVSEDQDVPLLIDQPEDNIDNHTIAEKLTDWIFKMKFKRQLIVVTHDPNIVVNADAENVIVCNQEKEGIFAYSNNPLETKESLSAIVQILEGGKEALERRIGKYGN